MMFLLILGLVAFLGIHLAPAFQQIIKKVALLRSEWVVLA